MRTSALFSSLVILAALLLGLYELVLVPAARSGNSSGASTPNMVTYFCDEGLLSATYATSSVDVKFPNGSVLAMPQTMSASGVRYEASSTVFWSKGSQAFVMIGNTTTYNNCVAGTAVAVGSTTTYTDTARSFSVSYPSQFTLSGGEMGYTQSWLQNATTSGMLLAKISVPASLQPNTNFASSRLTIGANSDPSAVATCLTQINPTNASSSEVSINGVPFTKISYGDAGAGNFYEYTSYRTVHQSQCYAVEYVIHSLNIGNFPPERNIRSFDKAAVQRIFESIVQSFVFLQ